MGLDKQFMKETSNGEDETRGGMFICILAARSLI